jgi:hypothetical protein
VKKAFRAVEIDITMDLTLGATAVYCRLLLRLGNTYPNRPWYASFLIWPTMEVDNGSTFVPGLGSGHGGTGD